MTRLELNLINIFIILSLALITASPISASSNDIDCLNVISNIKAKGSKEDFKRAYCNITNERYEQGYRYLKGLERKLPEIKDYVAFYRAEALYGLGKNEEALKLYKNIVKKYHISTLKNSSLERIATIYDEGGKSDEAIVMLQVLVQNGDSSWLKARHLNSIAEIYINQNNIDQALNTYKQIWVNYPQTNYSKKYFKFNRSLNRKPVIYGSDILTRADNLYEVGIWDEALKEYLKLNPTSEINVKTAICLYKLKRYKQAAKILKETNTPKAIFWHAKTLSALGRPLQAADTYSSTSISYPTNIYSVKGLYNAGMIYSSYNQTDKALDCFSRIVRNYPNSTKTADAAWNIGWNYYKKAHYLKSLELFSSHSYPENSFNSQSNQYWKAKTLEKLGRRDEAIKLYKEIAFSDKFTYHSFLARKRLGLRPNIKKHKIVDHSNAFNDDPVNKKAKILIEMGFNDFAKNEIEILKYKASKISEKIYVSNLYLDTGEPYIAVSLVESIDNPAALYNSYPRPYLEHVMSFSKQHDLDYLLVYSLIREESRYDTNAVSRSNARGLMQLIPPTARETAHDVGIKNFTIDKLFIPEVNIALGTYYLKYVLDWYVGQIPLALSAYNAGPNRTAEWLEFLDYSIKDEFVENIPIEETRNYVKRILRSYGAYKALY